MTEQARPTTLAANGWTFNALEWGPADGAATLLLHGFPQRATSWGGVARRLSAAGRRVVAVDQRGYSPGARPAEVADYAMANLVADVAAVIDALGGPVDLVGHDWGGVVGWQVAARHPDRVRTWTALSTPCQPALNEVLAANPEERARFGYILQLRAPGSEDGLLADGAAGLRAVYGDALTPARLAEDVAFFGEPGVLAATVNWYRAMSANDADGLPPVRVPTTYVWGNADIAFSRAPAERTGAYMQAPYEFVELDGASHWLPDEAPDAVADAVLRRVSAQ
jgi:pimeloyl-ACP methyl ester carboxylesterase